MPIQVKELMRKARARDWKCDSMTIKIPDDSHPFGARQRNFNIEINYSKTDLVWFGFSLNTDNPSKKERALSLKEICMEKLLQVAGSKRKLLEGNDSQLGTPGQSSSYIFYGAKVALGTNTALDDLQELFDISRDIQIPD